VAHFFFAGRRNRDARGWAQGDTETWSVAAAAAATAAAAGEEGGLDDVEAYLFDDGLRKSLTHDASCDISEARVPEEGGSVSGERWPGG
jgi:hypothetical protein